MQQLPAGTWPSPVSAASLVAGARYVETVVADGDAVWWSEQRPDEGGRIAVLRRAADGRVSEITPPAGNARTRVHEYGGGAWWAAGDSLVYSEFADGRLRRLDVGDGGRPGMPMVLTPEPDRPHGLRYADGRPTPDGRWFVCVRERHVDGREPVNELVAVRTDGSGEVRPVAGGADFYSSPRISPDGRRVAWIQWDHPNMPWDVTELWVADLADGVPSGARCVVGNGAEALQQPEWTDTGRLLVVTDRTDWWNVYSVDLASGELVHAAGGAYDIVEPAWVFGGSSYVAGTEGVAAHVARHPEGDRLVVGDRELATGCTALGDLRRAADGSLLFVGASYRTEPEVFRLHGDTLEVLRPSGALPLAAEFLPPPELIEFPTTDGVAFGLFYAPAHADVELPSDELPPVIVMVHGGPTAQAGRQYAPSDRFWTSRGFALLHLDYRGSSGYGRAYRNLLRGNWCKTDVEDAVAAVDHLVERGLVDGRRAVIRGGSAGGTTTLLALALTDRFATGADLFGVADLAALITDDHKFESRYTVSLVGPYPEAAGVYTERSPLTHVDRLHTPLIVFQGLEDRVVPPAHSERIVDAVHARGLPVGYVAYEGEGHGFRRAENRIRTMEAELWFYGQVLGFTPADEIEPVSLGGRG